jgi:Lon protease-like protein
MMDNDLDLRDFSNVTRLFPLASFVMFPHVVLPLRIFEPRYRQMTEDALAGDQLITIIQISQPPLGKHWPEPVPLEQVGCLGKIIQYERLHDGRFNMLLLGRRRVRLKREIASDRLFRSSEVEILEDIPSDQPEGPQRAELIELFRQLHRHQQGPDPDLANLLETAVPLGVLADIVSYAMSLPPALKQRLLAEVSVEQRVALLTSVLGNLASTERRESVFPPPFSTN